MISSRRVDAAAGVRVLLLAVLLGLFAMHALTAHGGDHHAIPGGAAAHASTNHSANAGDGAPTEMVHPAALTAAAPAPAVQAVLTVLIDDVAKASPGASGNGAELMLCWLLVTAGTALLALLLRAGRSGRHRIRPLGPPPVAGSSRPRAPPGRVRLHELTVLRV